MPKKKSKPRKKLDATDKFYRAAANYVESIGGKAVVIGGTQIIQWPTDASGNFTLGIRIMGRRPTKEPE